MKFEIHKKYRYDPDYKFEEDYDRDYEEYIRHLSKMNFKKAPELLKYWGLSFFHDGIIHEIHIETKSSELSLIISTDNNREDLNTFLENHGMPPIEHDTYEKNPILYKCRFLGLSHLKMDVDSTEELWIMDSELGYTRKRSKYLVTISFSEVREIELACDSATVEVMNTEQIRKYTNNLISDVPYCSGCQAKMLTEKNLKNWQPPATSERAIKKE